MNEEGAKAPSSTLKIAVLRYLSPEDSVAVLMKQSAQLTLQVVDEVGKMTSVARTTGDRS